MSAASTPDLLRQLMLVRSVSVYGRSPRIDVPDDAPVGERHPEPSSLRDAFFSEYGEHGPTAVYDAAQLQVGDVIDRPASSRKSRPRSSSSPAGR